MFTTPSPSSSPPSPGQTSPSTTRRQTPPGRASPTSSPPTSPQAKSTTSPPAPPLPWLWTCHCCTRRYNIAITRRCLSCGHDFCLWQMRRIPATAEAAAAAADDDNDEPATRSHSQHAKEAHDVNLCAVEFDYAGWREWMAWRREVSRLRATPETGPHGTPDGRSAVGDEEQAPRGHDCSVDCDYPSQCLRERYLALREMTMQMEERGMEVRGV
ncbi:hypothetical protein E4U21_002373 [Claviceps maximensis]|nr:hypothetical protein E4U21_002373 [Claviceps maximensis]